jgi:hypothetical protein
MLESISTAKIIFASILIYGIFILLLIFTLFLRKKRYVSNGIPYKVVNNRRNKDRAMHILDFLNTTTLNLVDGIDRKYKNSKSLARESIDLVMKNYNPDLLVENDPILTYGDKTYTMNQRRISICLRKQNGDFYDMNTLIFVFLHEISHVGTPKRFVEEAKNDHPKMFWAVFKFYLQEAVQAGIYSPIKYTYNNSIKYCGVDIIDNPYYDANIVDIK